MLREVGVGLPADDDETDAAQTSDDDEPDPQDDSG
jgi:hypothetical protein